MNLQKDITNHEYLMDDIIMFPKVISLTLDIRAKGHSCGPSLYHVLRMSTGVRKLDLTYVDKIGSTKVILSFFCLHLIPDHAFIFRMSRLELLAALL